MNKKALIIATLALAIVAGLYAVYEKNQNLRLRARVRASEQPQLPPAEQDHGGQRQPEALNNSTAPSNEQLTELLRLRNEHREFQEEAKEIEKLREENRQLRSAWLFNGNSGVAGSQGPTTPVVAKDSWAFVGYATPEDTFQSATWAMSKGDLQAMLTSLAPELQQKTAKDWQGKTETEIATQNIDSMTNVTGFQILGRIAVSEDEVHMLVHTEGEDLRTTFIMRKIGDEWRISYRAKYQSF